MDLSSAKLDLLALLLEEENIEYIPVQAISPRKNTENLELSFAQKRLWILNQLEPGNPFYNIPAALKLKGKLDVDALKFSFNEIIQRHEVLRTKFNVIDGQPILEIVPQQTITLPIVDLREIALTEREAKVQSLADAEFRKPFNLASEPLLRGTLLQLDEAEYILLLTMHHIVSDGWSTDILIREVAAIYECFTQGKPSPLPQLTIQYTDYAIWQRKWLQGEVLETQLNYWKQQLAGNLPILELPTDRPRPKIKTYQGAKQYFQLSPELSLALKTLSQKQDCTLFMTLLAAFKALLYRYTGLEDIIVGSPIANRNRAEIESLIGFFVNTLVLRTDLSDHPTFAELLNRVRETTLSAYAHQDLPFDLLVEELQPQRNLSHTPLFQVMFVLQNAPISAVELSGLTVEPLTSEGGNAKFDLTLVAEENDLGISVSWEYNTDLFNDETITRIGENFQTLLEGIVANPQQRITKLNLLTQQQQHQLLVEWNNTETDYPQDQCIHQLFEAQVEKTPNAVAVVFENQKLTYRELNQKANQLAHYLQEMGVKPDVLVGICVERSLEMVIGILGILKAGGAYVPLDPSYPQQRLAFMLKNAQLSILITQENLLTTLPPHQAQVVCLDSDWEKINQQNLEHLTNKTNTQDLAYVIYTSGSTGQPKGVQITHGSLVNFLISMRQTPGLNQEDIFLSVTTLSFDIAALELYLPLIVGARVVIVSREVATDGMRLLTEITSSQATVMQATPATWRMLITAGWQGNQQLKILCGGESLDSNLAHQLLKLSKQVWNLYGPTETTIWSSVHKVENTNQSERIQNMVSIGRPIANTQFYILDQNQQLVPVGIPGELHIGGIGLAKGYLNRPELTKEKFISNPFDQKPDARLYKTGDLARYLPSGEIEYISRIDNQVKIRGFRIELGEIEAAINQHPAVQTSVVIAQAEGRIIAYWVAKQESILTISDLRHFLSEKLPNYMIPAVFVQIPALPLTPNGKLDRKALPAPDYVRPELDQFVAPRNPVEAKLAQIWAEVLRVEQVGIYDNFFDLGGDSILTIQIVAKANEAGLKLTPKQLFQHQSIVELVDVCLKNEATPTEQGLDIETLTSTPIQHRFFEQNFVNIPDDLLQKQQQIEDIYPLSPMQQGMLFHTLYDQNSAAYVTQTSCILRGNLDLSAFQQAWKNLIERHTILRTAFYWEGLDTPLQMVVKQIDLPYQQQDWRSLTSKEQQTRLNIFLETDYKQGFNPAIAPLMRLTLIQLADDTYQFVWSHHHLLLDGWSINVLLQEVFVLYQAFYRHQSPSLSKIRPYRDYIAWLQQQDLLEAQNFWRTTLKGFTTPTAFGINKDDHKSADDKQEFYEQEFKLSLAETTSLQLLAKQNQLTLNTVLQGIWALLLNHYSGNQDVVFGATVSGRPATLIGVESMVGLFINTLPVRVQIFEHENLISWLQQIQSQQIESRQYEYTPLAEVHKCSDVSQGVPLFESLMVFENFPKNSSLQDKLELEIDNTRTIIRNHYPLTLRVQPGSQLSLDIMCDRRYLEPHTINKITNHLEILLSQFVNQPQIQLKELANLLKTIDQQQQVLKEQELEKVSLQKFKQTRRKAIRPSS
jgi:amino acid adenylation domain-containing protein